MILHFRVNPAPQTVPADVAETAELFLQEAYSHGYYNILRSSRI
jgi:hypothetical protein